MSRLHFEHVIVDPNPPGSEHDICLLGDLTGNGLPDIIIGSKRGPVNLFWYENPGWKRHDMAVAPDLEAGGVLYDINRDGRLDIVAGQQMGHTELYWFEQPADPRDKWTKHIIENRLEKYHDQAIEDVDGDGEEELVIASQGSRILAYYDIPEDPYASPWPESCRHIIAEDIQVEGLVVVDIDKDGRKEIIAGPNLLWKTENGWTRQVLVEGYRDTRVAVCDLDDDGQLELILAEGESNPARLAWCKGPDWRPHLLSSDLFHPHSLDVADFDGDGLPDIFVAEMGLGRNSSPRMFIYLNQGSGEFEQTLVAQGIPTHEAKVADMTGDGRPDIVGKPYRPERHIDLWINRA